MNEPIVYLNGAFIPASQARLNIYDLGIVLGATFTEMTRTFRHQPYDVVNADEAWLTTTPYCIAPCTCINSIPIGLGAPGPLYQRILAAWSQRVGLDIERQILSVSQINAKTMPNIVK